MALSPERSVDALKRSAAQRRSELSGTVDQLRAKVSPDAIKADVSEYFRTRGDALVEKARENPLQTAAIGALLAYPLLGIVKAIPAPVLMIGAGLFFLGTSTGQKISRQVGDVGNDLLTQASDQIDAAGKNIHNARDAASGVIGNASTAASDAFAGLRDKSAPVGEVLSAGFSNAKSAASNIAQSVTDRVSDLRAKASVATSLSDEQSTASASDGKKTVSEMAAALDIPTVAQMRQTAAASSEQVVTFLSDAFQQRPLVVGGIGLAIGMLLASALPRTQVESALLGEARSDLKRRAGEALSQGYDAAKESVDDLGRRVRTVAENAVTTALELPAESTTDAA